jgi:hypothetical protein
MDLSLLPHFFLKVELHEFSAIEDVESASRLVNELIPRGNLFKSSFKLILTHLVSLRFRQLFVIIFLIIYGLSRRFLRPLLLQELLELLHIFTYYLVYLLLRYY